MLAQYGRRPFDSRRRATHIDGITDELHGTHLGMLDLYREAISFYLRIREHFVQSVDRRGRNVFLREAPQPVGPVAAAKDRLQLLT